MIRSSWLVLNLHRMTKRRIFFSFLTLLAMCIAIWFVLNPALTWRLYPYFFPQHVCFTKDGVDLGIGEKCLADRKMIFEEQAIQRTGQYDTVTSVFSEISEACKKACQNQKMCTRYVVVWPLDMYDRNIGPPISGPGYSFGCHLIGSEPRKAN